MTIIDFHTHVFPDDLAARAIAALVEIAPVMKPHTDGTLKGLQLSMKESDVDKSVLLPVATKASQVESINDHAITLQSPAIISFGAMHQDYPAYEKEIEKLKIKGIQGIKLHPEYQSFYVDDKKMFPLYESLQASGLIVVFHAGKDPGPFTNDHALPRAFKTIAQQFPRLKIVAAHMGGWRVWDEVANTMGNERIYFDTAAVYDLLSPNDFMRIVNARGINSILFGSDSPWFDQKKSIDWIDALPLSDGDKEKILYTNAQMLLGK